MHMGHARVYTIGDALARYLRMRGYDVLHPMGFDALGLPAENAAIKDGRHPAERTRENIVSFRAEMKSLGYRLRLGPRGRHRRPGVLPLEPVVLPADAGAGHGLPPPGQGQLVHRLPHRHRQRAGWEGGAPASAAARRWSRRSSRSGPSASPGTRRRCWTGSTSSPTGPSASPPCSGTGSARARAPRSTSPWPDRASHPGLHHPHRHHLRLHLRGAGARSTRWSRSSTAPERRAEVEAFVARMRKTDAAERTGEGAPKEGVFTGARAVNPFTGRAGAGLDRQLRAGRVRHRRGDERPGPRPARLRVRREVRAPIRTVIQPAHGERTPPGDRLERATTDDGVLEGSGPFTGLDSETARRRMSEHAEKQGFGQRHGALAPARLGLHPPALLGHAHPHRLLRRAWRGPGPGGGPAGGAATSGDHHRHRRATAGQGPGVREHHLPALRQAGPARGRDHGHLRGLVLVLRPLPVAEGRDPPVRSGGRRAGGCRWTSTWAGPSTR